jgi:hypothetical protein
MKYTSEKSYTIIMRLAVDQLLQIDHVNRPYGKNKYWGKLT